MCYYHLDNSQRIQSLGFTNVNNRVQPVRPARPLGRDNSHYVLPSTGHLAFGEGGIDDDEDAGRDLARNGHSIRTTSFPGWGGGQEGQMGEGFGDYWAHVLLALPWPRASSRTTCSRGTATARPWTGPRRSITALLPGGLLR